MPKPVESGKPDIYQLSQRVEDCDTYHMAFDGVAREFHAQVVASASDGSSVDFERFFNDIEQAQRTELLRDMYEDLEPEEKLKLIVHLTGSAAIQEFLKTLVEGEDEYEQALLKISAESEHNDTITMANIPADAEVMIYMSEQSRVSELEREEMGDLPYDRGLCVRALGNGRFKVLEEIFGASWNGSGDEGFDIDSIIRIGTSYEENDGRACLEPVCRFGEGISVKRGKHTAILKVADSSRIAPVVITSIGVDGETVMPL
jgi:hypothetical protein